jgi:hypothetical protein
MFDRTQIDERVQNALFRKINAMNRKRLDGNDTNFFVGGALEPQDDSNPIEQHLYRGCFAKVSVAVPKEVKDKTSKKSTIVQTPISISSYIENKSNTEGILESVTQKNEPLAFQQGFQEKSDNRFSGHSGITTISVDQLEYYTNKFTIGWVCPDPVFFEDTFTPSFLKMGATCAIEFGWGIDDSSMDNVESLSIEEMRRLIQEPGRLTERNLNSSGNYFCGVGTVTKFDWKIQENGIYAGDLQVLTMGASPFLETTQGTATSADTIPVRKIKNTLEEGTLSKDLLDNGMGLTEDQKKDLKKSLVDATTIKKTLQANSVAFNLAIKNLDKVMDYFLKDATEKFYQDDSNAYDNKYSAQLKYKYSDGLMRIDGLNSTKKKSLSINVTSSEVSNVLQNPPDFLKERHFASWGWFEDNILKTFFEMKSDNGIVQTVDSRKSKRPNNNSVGPYRYEPNKCQSSDYLYSLGLDSVILPGKTNQLLENGFKGITHPILVKLVNKHYKTEQRVNYDRIRLFFDRIDTLFPKFVGGQDRTKNNQTDSRDFGYTANTDSFIDAYADGEVTDDERKKMDEENIFYGDKKYGIIRNMVFPIKMFQTHFQNTPSLRQGLRNFWADVTNKYGGYWGFELGQDGDNESHIGVFDSYYGNEKRNDIDKLSTQKDLQGIFEFSVHSKNSIVKSFDVNLNMSAEAATLARYGGFTKANTGTTRIDGKKELGLEAWNILTSNIDESNAKTLEDLKRYYEIQPLGLKNLRYTSEDSGNFMSNEKLLKTLSEDDKKIIEKLETERTQFIQGIGCYDNRGNFSQYFKQTMVYLINYSDLENSGSNISTARPLLPVSISMTLDGISGLKVGNLFKVDYLPELYRKYCYFMITKVGHKITTAGWDTEIEAVMIMDMSKYWTTSGRSLSPGLEDYIELFKLTDLSELDEEGQQALFNAFQQKGNEGNFDELDNYNKSKKLVENSVNSLIKNPKNTSTRYDSLVSQFKTLTSQYNELQDFFNIIERTEDAAKLEEDFAPIEKSVSEVLNDPKYWSFSKKVSQNKEAGKKLLEERGGAFGY